MRRFRLSLVETGRRVVGFTMCVLASKLLSMSPLEAQT